MNYWKKWMNGLKRRAKMREQDAKTEAVRSDAMAVVCREWMDVFYNRPPWAKLGEALTKFGAVASGYAATLASSETTVNTGAGSRARFVQEQLDIFLKDGLRGSVQLAAAGGMAVLKPYVKNGGIYCSVVKAGDFYPTEMNGGQILSGAFTDSAVQGGKTYLRIEQHEMLDGGVRICNRVFDARDRKKAVPLPLSTVPQWAGLAPETVIEGLRHPLFAVLKMPFANTVDETSLLPVSLYANAMDTLRELDRIYNEFLWEIKTGRRKQIIDITAAKIKNAEDIRNGKSPQIATSDQYLVLDFGTNPQNPFADYTPEMRVAAYQTALNIQLRLLESQCGLSAETFSFDVRGGQARTATEVLSDDKSTYNTIKAIQEGGMRRALTDLIAIYDVYTTLYRLAPRGQLHPGVDFGDSVFEDTGVEFERRKQLADGGYIKKEELTAWYFGVSAEQARAMMPPDEATV